MHQPTNLDAAVADFTSRVTQSAELHIKKTSGQFRPHKKTAWWNAECRQAVSERHHAWNVMSKHPTAANLELYQAKCVLVKQLCKASKQTLGRNLPLHLL
jgi:hypothetical protein